MLSVAGRAFSIRISAPPAQKNPKMIKVDPADSLCVNAMKAESNAAVKLKAKEAIKAGLGGIEEK